MRKCYFWTWQIRWSFKQLLYTSKGLVRLINFHNKKCFGQQKWSGFWWNRTNLWRTWQESCKESARPRSANFWSSLLSQSSKRWKTKLLSWCRKLRHQHKLENIGSLSSVTRFGEISPLWQNFTSLWQIVDSLFLIWHMLILFGRIGYIIGLIFIVANSQILKKILTIWSHWLLHFWDWFQQR